MAHRRTGLKMAASAIRSRRVSSRRRQKSSCASGSARPQKRSSASRLQPSAGVSRRMRSNPRSTFPFFRGSPRALARTYSTWAGLTSTAVTSSPRAARSNAVHPAEAMQNTRPPGWKARSSTALSSYIRPKSSSGGPARRSRRPRCHAVRSRARRAGILLRRELGQSEKGRVFSEQRPDFGYVAAAENESAGIHSGDESRSAGGGGSRSPAAQDPNRERRLGEADADKNSLGAIASEPGDRCDEVDLFGAAPQQLAPETVIEPHAGDRRGRKSAAEIPLQRYASCSRRLWAKASRSSSSPVTSASSSSAFRR